MQPTIYEGDIVIFHPLETFNKPLSEGLIVIANHPLKKEMQIIKRINNISNYGFELLGDNPESSIDSRQFGLIPKHLIKGIVENIISSNFQSP